MRRLELHMINMHEQHDSRDPTMFILIFIISHKVFDYNREEKWLHIIPQRII